MRGEGAARIERLQSELLDSLDHGIHAPLSGIIGMADLLLETSLDAEQREYVTAARLCAQDLLDSVSVAVEYSALSAGQLRAEEYEFNVREVLESSVADYRSKAESRGIPLFLALGDSLPGVVSGDGRRLARIVSQLIAYAIECADDGRVEVRAAREVPSLRLTVGYTGASAAAERLQLAFASPAPGTPGSARQLRRFGIGLALAKGLTDMLGGHMDVRFRAGEGGAFTVRLPFRRTCGASARTEDSKTGSAAGEPALAAIRRPAGRTAKVL